MRVVVDGTEYELRNVVRASVRSLIALENESEAEGKRITMGDLEAWQKLLAKCKTNAEREDRQESKWLFAVMLWDAFREAGAPRTFGQVIDIDLTSIEYRFDPSELAPVEPTPDPTKPPRPTTASGRATKAPEDRKRASKPKFSVAS